MKVQSLALLAVASLLLAPALAYGQSTRVKNRSKLPDIKHPILGSDPDADAIVAAMQVFPPDNPWNTDVSKWPAHPNSDAIVASIGADKPLRYNTDMAYVLVPPIAAEVDVAIVEYPDESDKGPFRCRTTCRSKAGPSRSRASRPTRSSPSTTCSATRPDIGGDRHAIVVDPQAAC